MEQDKYHAMAVIAAGAGGLRADQVAGLAHIFRQIARDERAQVIFDCIKAIQKARRTKVVGPEHATPSERRAWDKTRYDTFKAVEEIVASFDEPRGSSAGEGVDTPSRQP